MINHATAVKLAQNLNINIRTKLGQTGEYKNKKEREIDVNFAQTLSKFLTESVIPSVVLDLQQRALSCIDGEALTQSLHNSGVNMRYLGVIAAMLWKQEQHPRVGPSFVLEACEMEMVARVATRMFGNYLCKDDKLRAAPITFLKEFLNALMNPDNNKKSSNNENKKTSPSNKKKKKGKKSLTKKGAIATIEKLNFNAEMFWSKLRNEVSRKYKYELQIWGLISSDDDGESKTSQSVKNKMKRRRSLISLLRRVCLRCGIVLKQRDYRTNSISKEDIVNITPVTRSSVPSIPLHLTRQILDRVNALVNTPGANIVRNIAPAYTNAQRALEMLYHVCGASHVETVRCMSTIADITFRVKNKSALIHQRHVVELLERLRGVNHFETLQARVKLALMMFTLGEKKESIELMLQCVRAMDIVGGKANPETASLYLKLGKMYRIVFQPTMANRCYNEALRRSMYDKTIQVEAYRELALLTSDVGNHSHALKIQKRAYELCTAYYGPKATITEQSKAYYKAMTQRLVDASSLK